MFADHGWPWHQCSHQPSRRHSHFFVVNSNFFWIRLWSRSPFFLVAATQFLFLYPMTVYVSICLFVCLSLSIPRYLHTHTHTHFTHVSWLVVWNIWTFFHFTKMGMSSSQLTFLIFFRGVAQLLNHQPVTACGSRFSAGPRLCQHGFVGAGRLGRCQGFFGDISIYLWLSM